VSQAPLLFGTDGIRGIAGQFPLQKPFIRKLGAASAAVFRQEIGDRKPIFLSGRDTRNSGPWIAAAFADGADLEGVQVLDAGVISTPSLAYLVSKRDGLGGVMISASHNPADFNGIKLFSPLGRKCPDAWERLIEKKVTELEDPKPRRVPRRKDPKGIKDYLDFLKRSLPPRVSFRGLSLVVDCSHGALSKIAPGFLRASASESSRSGPNPTVATLTRAGDRSIPRKCSR
jgi:phosphoglucosamine mutase